MKVSTKIRRGGVGAVALGVGAMLALAAPATTAISAESPPLTVAVIVDSPAVLVARGAALTVPVDVVCTAGASGSVSLQVSQRVGSAIASGWGGQSFECTGGLQSLDVHVQASGAKSFKKGSAVVDAYANAFNDFTGGSASDTAVVEVARR